MNRSNRIVPGAAAVALVATGVIIAGPLNPPAGPITSTYKALNEVEPRIAVNAVNTRGDADSVYRITQPGSYYLTGNITRASAKSGIEIAANDVTIDLMGFSLIGVPGSLQGIVCDGARNNITVRNEVVRGFGVAGLAISATNMYGDGGLLERLHISNNGGHGCHANNGTAVRNCVARENNGFGFYMLQRGSFESCAAVENNGWGISIGDGGSLLNCVAEGNAWEGFNLAGGVVASDCSATYNGGISFSLFTGCTLTDSTATGNSSDGIYAVSGNVIRGNNCHANGFGNADGAGIDVPEFGSMNRLESNHCAFGDRGIDVDRSANIIIGSTSTQNTVNWTVVAGNVCQVVVAATGSAVTGNAGGTVPGPTSPGVNDTY